MLRRSIPTAVTATFTFYAVYYMALIILTDYRLGFNMRPEIGDITTYGSYYEDSPRSSLRPLRGSAIHSSAASPVHSYGGHGDLLSLIGFLMFERFMMD